MILWCSDSLSSNIYTVTEQLNPVRILQIVIHCRDGEAARNKRGSAHNEVHPKNMSHRIVTSAKENILYQHRFICRLAGACRRAGTGTREEQKTYCGWFCLT